MNKQKYKEKFNRRQEKWLRPVTVTVRDVLLEQLDYTVSLLRKNKSIPRTIASLNQDTFVKTTNELLNDVWTRVGLDFSKVTLDNFEFKALDVAFIERFKLGIATNLLTRGANIANTTTVMLETILGEAVTEGLGINQAAKKLKQEFTALSKSRSIKIARTEIVGASNYGSYTTVKHESELIGLEVQKEWLASSDGRTRGSHSSVAGQVRPLDSNFEVNGSLMEYPGDPNGQAGEVVNCRCTQIWVFPDSPNYIKP